SRPLLGRGAPGAPRGGGRWARGPAPADASDRAALHVVGLSHARLPEGPGPPDRPRARDARARAARDRVGRRPGVAQGQAAVGSRRRLGRVPRLSRAGLTAARGRGLPGSEVVMRMRWMATIVGLVLASGALAQLDPERNHLACY